MIPFIVGGVALAATGYGVAKLLEDDCSSRGAVVNETNKKLLKDWLNVDLDDEKKEDGEYPTQEFTVNLDEKAYESQEEDVNLYIFQDGNQAIYSSSDELPIDEVPLYLTDNCRNTKSIHNAAYKFYQGEEIDEPNLEGEPIDFILHDSLEKQAMLLDKKINQLINEEKISPKDIVVLSMNDFNQVETMLSNSKKKNIWAFKDFEPQKHVLVDTAKRFKGLESKIVFLWITDPFNIDEKLLYVSISRARLRLWVVGDSSIKNKIE